MSMQFSRFLCVRTRGEEVAIFHSLHPDAIRLPRAVWERFQKNKSEPTLIKRFREKKLIVNLGEDEEELQRTQDRIREDRSQTNILSLMLAQHCNAACAYCPIPELTRIRGEKLMSVEDAVAGVQLWQQHLGSAKSTDIPRSLIFYGGEPLLNRKVIEKVSSYVRHLQFNGSLPNVNLIVPTNGSLVDESFADLCHDHSIIVSLGIDGFDTTRNQYRIMKDGESLIQATIAAIRILTRKGVTIQASVCVTPANVDYLEEIGSDLKDAGVNHFGFNLLKGRWIDSVIPTEEQEDYYRHAARAIIRCSTSGVSSREARVESKRQAFDRHLFFPQDCPCYGNQLVVQADGEVSGCPFHRITLGHVQSLSDSFRISDTESVRQQQDRCLPSVSSVDGPWAQALYGGGCAWNTYELSGDTKALDRGAMIFAEEVLDGLLWK